MLFVTEYELREDINREGQKRLMELFGRLGNAPGEVAHYARVDGGGGYVVSNNTDDDIAAIYERILEFGEFMRFSITPIMRIDDAVGPILKVLAD